jgi:hypothetical protein
MLYRVMVHCVSPMKLAGTVGSNLDPGRSTCGLFDPGCGPPDFFLQNNFCVVN